MGQFLLSDANDQRFVSITDGSNRLPRIFQRAMGIFAHPMEMSNGQGNDQARGSRHSK
jgi:hypothetical protein